MDPSSVCLLVVLALSEFVLCGWKSLGQGAPVDENDPFADLEPDIFEEERNEIVVHEDWPIRTQTLLRTFVDTNIKDVGDIAVFKL